MLLWLTKVGYHLHAWVISYLTMVFWAYQSRCNLHGFCKPSKCDIKLTLLFPLLYMPRDAIHTGRDGNNQEDDIDTSACTLAVHRESHCTGTGDKWTNEHTWCVYSRANNVQSIMGHGRDSMCEQLLLVPTLKMIQQTLVIASSSPMPRHHMQRCRHPVSPVRHQHHLHRLYPSLNTSTSLLSVSLTFTTTLRTWLRGSFTRRFNTESSQVMLAETTRGREADCVN